MSYKVIEGQHIVDWTTGDPEGDRAHLFRAYREFLKELKETDLPEVLDIFNKWSVEDLNIDDFSRIQIERPEDKQFKQRQGYENSKY